MLRNKLSRRLATIAALVALGSSLTLADASAGKKKKDKGPPVIEMTGIKTFDNVFTQLKSIDDTLTAADSSMKTAKQELNVALALKKGTPLKAGLADLKQKADGKVKVVMKGKQPTLEPTDAIPQNVQDALTAVNTMTGSLQATVEGLATVDDDLKRLVKRTNKFPEKLKDELQANPLESLFKAPKILKTLKGNTVATTALPNKSTKVMGKATGMLVTVSELAPINPPDEGSAKAPAEKTPTEKTKKTKQ